MSESIHEAVKKTVAWFSLFNYPLTITELWQWLWSVEKISFQQIFNYVNDQKINYVPPFLVLKNEEKNIETRAQRNIFAIRKQQKAKRSVYLLSLLPWVEGVALCNSLGYQNARDESDIDFFIITKPNTIWLTRFLSVVALKIFGHRPSEEHGRDTLCFSFYVTTEALNLQSIALPNGDIYLTYWITQLTPMFGRGNVWENFFKANEWVKTYLSNVLGYSSENKNWYYINRPIKKEVGKFVRLLNSWAKNLQIKYFSKKLYILAINSDGNVVMSDHMLKLHTKDRRADYQNKWREKYEKI